jgi:hypothetical protein
VNCGVEQLLAWNDVTYENFCSYMGDGSWARAVGSMIEVLRVCMEIVGHLV